MPTVHVRLTGSQDDLRILADLVNDLDGIERIEEIADLMPHMDDEDSSSAGLSDAVGPGIHELEIEVPNPSTARKLEQVLQEAALRRGLVIEFETED